MQRKLTEWTNVLTRVIAAGGLIYEILVDHLKNPTALVVFGGLAGLPDVLGYRAKIKEEIEKETKK